MKTKAECERDSSYNAAFSNIFYFLYTYRIRIVKVSFSVSAMHSIGMIAHIIKQELSYRKQIARQLHKH